MFRINEDMGRVLRYPWRASVLSGEKHLSYDLKGKRPFYRKDLFPPPYFNLPEELSLRPLRFESHRKKEAYDQHAGCGKKRPFIILRCLFHPSKNQRTGDTGATPGGEHSAIYSSDITRSERICNKCGHCSKTPTVAREQVACNEAEQETLPILGRSI